MVFNTTLYPQESKYLWQITRRATDCPESLYFEDKRLTTIGQWYFGYLPFRELSFPNATTLQSGAFYAAQSLVSLTLPWSSITTIPSNCFGNCYLLSGEFTFQNCTTIGSQAFSNCSNITALYFPNVTGMSSSQTFFNCTKLKSVSFGSTFTDWVRQYAFSNCTALTDVNLGNTATIELRAFQNCQALKSIYLPNCNSIYQSTFWSCYSLSMVVMSGKLSGTISAQAFNVCRTLLSLYLLGSLVKPLANVNAFASTPISTYTTYTDGQRGSIFVPSSLYASYIAATNWTTYSARFVSMTDQEIEDFLTGTINITAEFNQGNNIIYSNDSLDSLKQYLTVTAQLIDGQIVVPSTDYTLSGSLSAVVNTITVSYSGKTATFEVIPRAGQLPSGYTEVKYIESTKGEGGLTYINTTYQIDKDKTILYIKSETIERNFGWFCADGSDGQTYGNYCNNGMGYYFSYGGASFGYGVTSFGYNDSVAAPAFSGLETEYSYPDKYVKNRTSGYVYNISPDLDYGAPNGSNQNVLIFARYGWNTSRSGFSTSDIKCYNAKIGELNTIVRDFVPCIRESDGEIGMYDVAGSTCPLTNTSFYCNAGSGTFSYA